MNIGIDIDGVLTDIEQWQLDYGSKVVFEKYNKGIVNSEGYDITEIFDVDKNLDDEFWRKYLFDYAKNEPARKFANEVTKKLHENGIETELIQLPDVTIAPCKMCEGGKCLACMEKGTCVFTHDDFHIIFEKTIDVTWICDRLDLILEERFDMGTVISVVSGKGGTGKSSTVVGVGIALSHLGKRVLCIDFDFGMRCLDLLFGCSDTVCMDCMDVMAGRCSLSQAVTVHPIHKSLFLLLAPVSIPSALSLEKFNVECSVELGIKEELLIMLSKIEGGKFDV